MATPILPGNLPLCTHRYALFASYLGTKYRGSQRLAKREAVSEEDTIQEAIEGALQFFLPKRRCRTTSCSRTDRGVHALMNCFTLPLMSDVVSTEKMKRLTNQYLMQKHHDILVNEVLLVPLSFHPRKSAKSREYIYRIAVMNKTRNHNILKRHCPVSLMHSLPVTELYKILPLSCFNAEKAMEAIDILKGEHDFASFAYDQTSADDTVRDLEIGLTQETSGFNLNHDFCPYSIYHLHFKSRSFLYNQVRRLVGAIVSYASYNLTTLDQIRSMLENPNSKGWPNNLIIAEPYGLFLSKIIYDKAAFEGAIKTLENNEEEKVHYVPGSTDYEGEDESDDDEKDVRQSDLN